MAMSNFTLYATSIYPRRSENWFGGASSQPRLTAEAKPCKSCKTKWSLKGKQTYAWVRSNQVCLVLTKSCVLSTAIVLKTPSFRISLIPVLWQTVLFVLRLRWYSAGRHVVEDDFVIQVELPWRACANLELMLPVRRVPKIICSKANSKKCFLCDHTFFQCPATNL